MDLGAKESTVTDELSTLAQSATASKVASTAASSAKFKNREDAAQEASERRRIWAMAAASAAEMIKELTQKAPPEFEDVTKVFAPITPSEWAEKRMALDALREKIDDTEDISDAQIADELFYDPDATDDDLGMFLGASDKDLKDVYRGSSGQIFKAKGGVRRSFPGAPQVTSAPALPPKPTFTEKSVENIPRKSIIREEEADRRRSSLVSNKSNMSRESSEREVSGHNSRQSRQSRAESTNTVAHQQVRRSKEEGEEATTSVEVNRRMSHAPELSQSNSNDDDFLNYMYEEPVEKSESEAPDENTDESEVELYFPADVNINVDEALVGLEDLLDDFKLESRITDRFKYKLINKYSLLLQALITYQERETETITHLQTKRKILNALHQFVKTEAEAAAKAVIAEEEKDEDKEEGQGQALDLGGGKRDEGGDKGDGQKQKENQGLSIEEMPAATIRETLLNQKNRLDVLECIKKVHVLQLKQLEFERTLLNLHYSKMVKPSDLSKEIKDGRRQVNDLQLEISSIHQEMGQIQNEIRIQEKHVIEEEKSVEKLELEALTKQGEVQVLANKPVHIAKEADREAQKLEQLQDTHDVICTRLMDMMEIYRTNQSKLDVLAAELTSLTKKEIKLAQQKKAAMKDYDALLSQMDNLMSREHMMLDRATLLTERMQTLIRTKKKMVEEQHRMFNDANKSLREAQRLERSIKMASDAFINAKLAYDKMRSAFDAVKPTEQNSQWEKLSRMLQKEIINLKTALDKKLDEANYKSGMVAKLQAKLNDLYEAHVASGKELQELIRTTVRKRREREEKSEQCIKLEAQIQRVVLEKKTREIAINDCLRSEKIIFKQLSQMQKRFNQLKMEKSVIINELSTGRLMLQETKLKIDDLGQKLNAYITQTQLFEGMTKEKYYIILNARIKRDSIKNEAMRSRQKFRFYRNQKMELLLNNKTLRREAEKQKHESIVIRKQFEKATNVADDMAIKYRIRMEEICTFHEYMYCYHKILLRGSEEITIREMEKLKLNALYEETRKHVFIVQMNQPEESDYFTKIEKLRVQFYQITETRRMLEVRLNEDDNQSRVREIDFDKMKEKENVEVLEKKLDLQEEYLAIRDVIGLEKTLLENHLTKITENALEQALHLKDFYGEHVKAITNIRRNLNNVSQQIEGFICENAIASAQADIAENMYNQFLQIQEEAEKRLQEGLAPTDEMEQEWNRIQWRNLMIKRANANSKKPGFFRQVKPWNGTQIQANKWTFRDKDRRKLEDPSASVLGWRFSAVTDPVVSTTSRQMNRFTCNKRGSGMKAGNSVALRK